MAKDIRGRFCATMVVCAAAFAPASAGAFELGENPISVILKWRPSTPDPEVRDFVKETRPADKDLDYKPLSAPKVDRPKLKSREELGAMVNGLDQAGAGIKPRGADASLVNPAANAQQLRSAAAESRRRAAEAFGEDAVPAQAPAAPAGKPAKAGRAAKPAT